MQTALVTWWVAGRFEYWVWGAEGACDKRLCSIGKSRLDNLNALQDGSFERYDVFAFISSPLTQKKEEVGPLILQGPLTAPMHKGSTRPRTPLMSSPIPRSSKMSCRNSVKRRRTTQEVSAKAKNQRTQNFPHRKRYLCRREKTA